jgi:hypothetical protein
MKRVKILAAAIPATVGLAAPVTAAAATTTGTATVPVVHGKRVAYPQGSHYQQVRRNALASSSGSSSASSRPVISRSASLPASPGALPRTATSCHDYFPTKSCMQVHGNGQHLSEISLYGWPSHSSTRTGHIAYKDMSTGHTFPDFRTRTKFGYKSSNFSFSWFTNCHVPHPGLLTGYVGGHTGRPVVHVHGGTTTGKVCSGA